MEHKNHDKVFFVNFSVVLGILTAIALFIGFVARLLAPPHDEHAGEQAAALAERVKPVTQAITSDEELKKLAAAKPARAPMTGDQVVAKVCGACHASGVLNAPKVGDAAEWNKRLGAEGGLDGLVAAAIKGKNAMPPRGGDPDLSDDEIKAAVSILAGK